MNPEDTLDTVYAVAFDGDKFLMVWNSKRNGWEMPGGHIKVGESPAEGARREFIEESGYDVRILDTRDLGHCYVCAAALEKKIGGPHEMYVKFFSDVPDNLAFPREEYLDTVPWSKNVYERVKTRVP